VPLPLNGRPWLEQIALGFSERGLEVRVHGSLLWQHLTGMGYLHPRSDLDLLCTLTCSGRFHEAAGAFEAAERGAVAHIDGEIFFPRIGWAAWREVAQATGRSVLIKHDRGELLIERNELFATSAVCGASRG
jgi:phosphoribosyl-dephospho-CoA transferase